MTGPATVSRRRSGSSGHRSGYFRGRGSGRRWLAAAVAGLAVIAGIVVTTPAADATGGHDPSACSPDDTRVGIPSNFYLDACYDGTYLVLINRGELPVFIDLTGDLSIADKHPTAGAVLASAIFDPLAPHLLVPGYTMKVTVGGGGGNLSIGYAPDVGRQYGEAVQLLQLLPGVPEGYSALIDFLHELDAVSVNYARCRSGASNVFAQTACAARFTWDVTYAAGRLVTAGVIMHAADIAPVIGAIKEVIDVAGDADALAGDMLRWNSSAHSLSIPAGLAGGSGPGAGSPAGTGGGGSGGGGGGGGTPGGTGGGASGPVALSIQGSCTSSGGTLTGSSSGFTPGGTAYIRAWYPDGSEYTNLTHSSAVRSDGTIRWTWPCAGDPAGQYTTEAVDQATGRSTGRVAFTIGAQQAATYTEQAGTKGAGTFRDPTNASGVGDGIPAMGYVEVSCKIKPATTIPSAYPDGYWYRIASPPWNNQYYAVAKNFWNGDVPGQTPYTHNTDWNVPDC